MPVINITVRDKIAYREEDSIPFIVSGNSDYAVVFDFDGEWDEYNTKTARFLMDGGYTDVVFDGCECAIPTLRGGGVLEVGVYAGDIRTTTSAEIGVKPCVTSGSVENAPPTPDIYAQIMEKLNSLISGGTGGGSVDGDALREMIEEALSAAKASGEFDGKDGEDGKDGAPGSQGEPGPKGDKGDTGAQGPKGDKGDTGAQGPKGDKGDKGDKGETGAAGAQGPAYTLTDSDKTTIVNAVKAALPTVTMVGKDADGATHTWTIYGS